MVGDGQVRGLPEVFACPGLFVHGKERLAEFEMCENVAVVEGDGLPEEFFRLLKGPFGSAAENGSRKKLEDVAALCYMTVVAAEDHIRGCCRYSSCQHARHYANCRLCFDFAQHKHGRGLQSASVPAAACRCSRWSPLFGLAPRIESRPITL